MKQFVFLSLFSLLILFSSCKKEKPEEEQDPDTEEICKLPENFHNDYIERGYTWDEHYIYEGRNIVRGEYLYRSTGGFEIHLHTEYFYANPEKGLLSRRDFYQESVLNSYRLYTYIGEKLIRIEQLDGRSDTLEIRYLFDYNQAGKMVRMREINRFYNMDNTYIYTYDNDDVVNIKKYRTSDLNTLRVEYDYSYSDHIISDTYINTKSWPLTNKHTLVYKRKKIYSGGQVTQTYEYRYNMQYDDDGFPIHILEQKDGYGLIYEGTISYKNCD